MYSYSQYYQPYTESKGFSRPASFKTVAESGSKEKRNRCVYLRLPDQISKEELQIEFKKYGPIREVAVTGYGQNRNAIVKFKKPVDAARLVAQESVSLGKVTLVLRWSQKSPSGENLFLPTETLYLEGLPPTIETKQLLSKFRTFSTAKRARLLDPALGGEVEEGELPHRRGQVEFQSVQDLYAAWETLEGTTYEGADRPIRLKFAEDCDETTEMGRTKEIVRDIDSDGSSLEPVHRGSSTRDPSPKPKPKKGGVDWGSEIQHRRELRRNRRRSESPSLPKSRKKRRLSPSLESPPRGRDRSFTPASPPSLSRRSSSRSPSRNKLSPTRRLSSSPSRDRTPEPSPVPSQPSPPSHHARRSSTYSHTSRNPRSSGAPPVTLARPHRQQQPQQPQLQQLAILPPAPKLTLGNQHQSYYGSQLHVGHQPHHSLPPPHPPRAAYTPTASSPGAPITPKFDSPKVVLKRARPELLPVTDVDSVRNQLYQQLVEHDGYRVRVVGLHANMHQEFLYAIFTGFGAINRIDEELEGKDNAGSATIWFKELKGAKGAMEGLNGVTISDHTWELSIE